MYPMIFLKPQSSISRNILPPQENLTNDFTEYPLRRILIASLLLNILTGTLIDK